MLRFQRINLFAFISCLVLLAAVFYLEYIKDLVPCPLCIAQRIVFIILGFIFCLAFFHNPHRFGVRIYGGLTLLTSVLGAGLAVRQIWLELNPLPNDGTCMPGLSYMLQQLPFTQTLKIMLSGSSDCANINWTFMNISMAGWSLIIFGILILISIWQLVRK